MAGKDLIDLGKYNDPSKFRAPSMFDNPGSVLQQLINQEIAGLDGSQHANFDSIIKKYPHISKEIVVALIRQGANANTPGIDKVVSLDGVNQAMTAATAIKKLPSLAEKDKNFLSTVKDAIYGGLKGTTRVGFAALRTPYDYLTTIGRNAYAMTQGEKGAGEAFIKDINPLTMLTGESTTLGALGRDMFDGDGVSTGSGFFISPESRVGKQQAKAMGAYGRINGQSFTIGRGLLKTVGADPNSTQYKILSGIVDATLNVATDPSTWLGPGALKVVKEGSKVKLAFRGLNPKISRGGYDLAEAKRIAAEETRLERRAADIKDLEALPSEKELLKQRSNALGDIKRDYDNHYMKAEDAYKKSTQPKVYKEEKTAAAKLQGLNDLLKISDVPTPGGVGPKVGIQANEVNDVIYNSIKSGSQAGILDNLTQLAADEKNTLNAFDGIFVNELPSTGVTFGSSGSYEFAVKKGISKEYKIVDLAEDFTEIAGNNKRAAREMNNRLALHTELEKLRNGLSLFEEEVAVFDRLNTQGFVDDLIEGSGRLNLGTFLNEVYKVSMEFDKTGGALAQIVNVVSKIWKADGFANIRSVHGGTGGFVLNPKVLSGKAIDASTVLGKSLNPQEAAAAMLDVEKVVQPSEEVIAKAQIALDGAKTKRDGLDQQIREIKALRKYVENDPDLAKEILNNPEYTKLKGVMDLEMQIGKRRHMAELLKADTGLISGIGGTPVADITKANKYLLGKRFAVVARLIANESSPSRISRLFGDKLDMDVVRELTDAGTADDVLRVLRRNLGLGDTDPSLARSALLKANVAIESMQPIIKLSTPVSQKMLAQVERMENALTRVVVRSVILPLDDLDRLSKGLRDWMSVVKIPENIIDETIDELVKATGTTTRSVKAIRSKIVQDAFTKAHVELVNRHAKGNPELLKILEDQMRIAGDVKNIDTKYIFDSKIPADRQGVMISDGTTHEMIGAAYAHQFLDSVVRLPDTKPIVRALERYMKAGPLVDARANGKAFADEVASVWKTTQLAFRISYMLRNVGEMQFRQYLSGHDTLLNHPIGYIAMLMADPNGSAWQKFASTWAKYENDILGNSFKNPQAAKAATVAIDEHLRQMSRRVSAGDARSTDVKVRMIGRIYKVIKNSDANYHEALATSLARFDVDDIMQLVAKADTDAAKNAIVDKLIANEVVKINNVDRTDILKEIYEASRVTVQNRKVSDFATLFLINPKLEFSYDNLNRENIYNWMFDPNSAASYENALVNLMGTGEKGIYIRKLLADGVVVVPGKKGDEVIRMPRYRDMNKYEDMDAADKAFKAQLVKHFTPEEMPGGRAIYADTKTLMAAEGKQLQNAVNAFFEISAKLENLVNFGPEYRMAYWDYIGRYAPAMSVADLYTLQANAFKTLAKIKVSGKVVGKKHPTLSIINREIRKRENDPIKSKGIMSIDNVNDTAARQASLYVKDLFYNANNQIDAANKLRLIFPFVQAWGNTIRKWGELGVQNPTKVIRFAKGFDSLTKPGSGAIYDLTNTNYDEEQGFFYKDEFGTQRFRYPLSGLFGGFAGMTQGKFPKDALNLTAPVQSLNLAFGSVNPGFPGLGPAISTPFLISGKSQAFGPTYDWMRDILFPFGEPGGKGVGGLPQILLPAWFNKSFLYLINDQTMVERGVKDWAGYLASTQDYGDNPFANDASRTALFADAESMSRWVGLLTSLFQSIAPATPSQDVLARIKTPENKYNFISQTVLYKAWDEISKANPGNYPEAVAQFMDKFGKENILPIISGSTKSITGTEDAWSFLNKNPQMADKYATKDADVIPYFFPGGETAVSYYNWQSATGRREKLSTEEIAAAAEELVYKLELSQIGKEQAENTYSDVWYTEQVIALNKVYGNAPTSNVITGRQEARAANVGKALKEEAFKMSPIYSETKEFYAAYNHAMQQLSINRVTPNPDLGSSAPLNTRYREELQLLGNKLMLENPAFSRMYYSVFANLLKKTVNK